MARIEAKLAALGLVLPKPLQAPPGVVLPFSMVRIVGRRAIVSGHGPLNADGTLAQPLGKVGSDLSIEQGYAAAKLTGLAILASLQRAIGDLDRIAAWTRVFGMVNSAPNSSITSSLKPLITAGWRTKPGAEIGAHPRSAVGLFELPFSIPVEIEAEVEFSS